MSMTITSSTAYLGPSGTWSEEAASRLAGKSRLVPCRRIRDIFKSILEGEVVTGVVPVENTIGGSVDDTLDGLFDFPDIEIRGETVLRINQALLSKVAATEVKRVLSHPNALSQCMRSLESLLPQASIELADSTASAAAIASVESGTAVTGSARLASIYGLEILEKEISDSPRNYTRFFMIGLKRGAIEKSDKTSIALALEGNTQSPLWKIIGGFSSLGVEILRVDSRPIPGSPGKYRYFLDLDGGAEDLNVRTAISNAEAVCSSIRVVGSYRAEAWPTH